MIEIPIMFSLLPRGFCLFLVGSVFFIVLNLLQLERKVALSPELLTKYSDAWWVAPACGFLATVIGLLYPFIDNFLGQTHKHQPDWSSVMRCIAIFVGINHASAKLEFHNNIQLSLTLAAMSIGLWWLFDRSRSGFVLALLIAIVATVMALVLVYSGILSYTEPRLEYMRSCIPSIFFSGGVTMGSIGRQLALSGKEHKD
ncbi:DgyrCDS13292 [Dimorphilus gyrociliatus]|uniref:DgyrCDS13292 n=1 Tax=Dimorphilus gyrociliatus TaxID=2664684 RepID=A0A7I8WA83_9ANNE|nr:DgyrCDS13292 [Dimorphilus gyrociliatus]